MYGLLLAVTSAGPALGVTVMNRFLITVVEVALFGAGLAGVAFRPRGSRSPIHLSDRPLRWDIAFGIPEVCRLRGRSSACSRRSSPQAAARRRRAAGAPKIERTFDVEWHDQATSIPVSYVTHRLRLPRRTLVGRRDDPQRERQAALRDRLVAGQRRVPVGRPRARLLRARRARRPAADLRPGRRRAARAAVPAPPRRRAGAATVSGKVPSKPPLPRNSRHLAAVPGLRHRPGVEHVRQPCARRPGDLRTRSDAVRAWRIIRSDRMLFASAVAAVVLVFAIVFGPPILAKILGHGSDTPLPTRPTRSRAGPSARSRASGTRRASTPTTPATCARSRRPGRTRRS